MVPSGSALAAASVDTDSPVGDVVNAALGAMFATTVTLPDETDVAPLSSVTVSDTG